MARRFFYFGDVSIEYGGYFYCLDSWQYGYVDALRVTPVSDAGGPDNVFWIEGLTVNIPKGDRLRGALDCVGIESLASLPRATRRHAIVHACIGYGLYDADALATVQVGPDDPFYGGRERFEVTHYLRASVNLRKLARRMAHGHALTECVKPLTQRGTE